ncbi:MAG: hypothetical protein M3401_16680 [Actinomycetota bacterium]|nr:hypothetical protein [Actinomycetota bacterium]
MRVSASARVFVRARERFVAEAAERAGTAAPAVVAAVDGLVLDALVRRPVRA